MNYQNVNKKYKRMQVETASQGKLLLMLYQGCIKFLRMAKKNIDLNKKDDASIFINRAQDIIGELMITLNHDEGGEIADNLYSLYDFMNNQLVEASIYRQKEPLEVVEELMLELLDAWQQVVNQEEAKVSSG